MKYILIITLLFASFVSFSQTLPQDTRKVKQCGFQTENGALSGSMLGTAQNHIANPDETLQSYSITSENGSYCYTNIYVCNQQLNKEQGEIKPIVQEIGCKTDQPLIVVK